MLRSGMWVRHGERVGIFFPVERNLRGTVVARNVVHYVNAKGETVEVAGNVSLDELSQAAFADIPKARQPSRAVAKRLGYLV